MKVKELIEVLSELDQEKDLDMFWDGGVRGSVEGVCNTSDGIVLVSDWSIYRSGTYRKFTEDQIVWEGNYDATT